jgi:hypothetical protein
MAAVDIGKRTTSPFERMALALKSFLFLKG